MKRALLLSALILGAAVPAAAQAPARVHITFGYRYVRASTEKPSMSAADTQGVHALALGAEVGATARLSPKVSLVATAGRSQSMGRAVTTAVGSAQPATGSATNSLTDVMGGVEFSGAATGPFLALLAGISIPGKTFDGPSNRGIFVPSLDFGRGRTLAIRPVVGVNIVPRSRRIGARLEAGFDIIPRVETFTSSSPDTIYHFRFAASGTIGVGRPMPPATTPTYARRFYLGIGAGAEIKQRANFRTPSTRALPAGFISLGKEVSRRVAIESVVQTEKSESVDWRWFYTNPHTENVATHRDTLILGQVRALDLCAGRACFEPFAGAGFVAHRAIDRIVAECGSSAGATPCAPVTPRLSGRPEWQWRFAANAGAAMRINISKTVAVSPMAQVSFFGHDKYLFRDNFRGPSSGKKWAPFVGVSLTIRP